MPLIKLDINYDPEVPDYMQGPPGWDPNRPPKPRFCLFNKGGVKVGPVFFTHKHRNTGGFDPYAGEQWTAKIASFDISLTNLICYEIEVHRGSKLVYRQCEADRKHMSFWFMSLWDFLEHRLEWYKWECNDDYFENRRYYE